MYRDLYFDVLHPYSWKLDAESKLLLRKCSILARRKHLSPLKKGCVILVGLCALSTMSSNLYEGIKRESIVLL